MKDKELFNNKSSLSASDEIKNLSKEAFMIIVKKVMDCPELKSKSWVVPFHIECDRIKYEIVHSLENNKFEFLKLKENYNKLLKSGMFFEIYPMLTGEWDVDKKLWSHDESIKEVLDELK